MIDTENLQIDPTNAGAFEAWDGGDGDYWAQEEAIFEASVARYDAPLLDAAAIGAGDHVLDVGCGNGGTTATQRGRATSGSALGVDLSSRMLENARRHGAEEDVHNVTFLQADAQIHPFEPGSFDVAISRTGTMFFGDQVAAFTNIARALRAGGRLAMVTWQPITEHEFLRESSLLLAAGRDLPAPPPDAPGPLSLSDPDRVKAILSSAGFSDIELEGRHEPMYFGTDTDDAFRFLSNYGFTKFMLSSLDDATRTRVLDEYRALLAAHETPAGVTLDSAAWIITARR